MTTRQKINQGLVLAHGNPAKITFFDREVDDTPEAIAKEYRDEGGWEVAVSQADGKTTFSFS